MDTEGKWYWNAPELPRGEVKRRTAEWKRERKPTTQAQRRALYETCENDCFLVPKQAGQPLRYPYCAKGTTDCQVDCDGLRAGRNDAAIVLNRKNAGPAAKRRAQAAIDNA